MITEMYSSSYAAYLEQRVISQLYITTHRCKGKFVFRKMCLNDHSNTWMRTVIGHEMAERVHVGQYRRQTEADGKWIFQCYDDGVGLYRRYLLNVGWTAQSKIDEVINHYFYEDTVIDEDSNRSWMKINVLRRKPCSPHATALARGSGLGDFLVNKYNMREEVPA